MNDKEMSAHVDEHTLELYVLNAPGTGEQRRDIESHLAACYGCRSIADELREFHAGLAEELQNRRRAADQAAGHALTRTNRLIAKYFEPFEHTEPYRQRPPGGRFISLVRRHPLLTGSTAVLAFTAAALLAFLPRGTFRPAPDTNPAFVRYNDKEGVLEIFNRGGESVLWTRSVNEERSKGEWLSEESRRRVVVADLDGDGRNEVISTVRDIGESLTDASSMKIFTPEGILENRLRVNASVHYRERTYYSPHFDPQAVVVTPDADGSANILLIANNVGRSPSCVCRLNGKGELLGRYWHFGHLYAMLLRDVDGDGRQELLVGGENDTPDTTTGNEFADLTVLDPLKISGEARATQCAGYALPPSDAEIAHIMIPRSDLNDLYTGAPAADAIASDRLHEVVVAVRTRVAGGDFAFHYYIDSTFSVTNVRSNGFTDKLHAQQVAAGKLTGTIDEGYLALLQSNVRYWDGWAWKRGPVFIGRHLP